MNKKIVIELSEEQVESLIADRDLFSRGRMDTYRAGLSIISQAKHQLYDKTERSMIEWHPIDETPKKKRLLIRDKNGLIFSDEMYFGDDLDWYLSKSYKSFADAWAYLPEGDEE